MEKNKQDEVWKDVVGFEGYYKVSNLGRVKSVERQVFNHTGFITLKSRIMKPSTSYKGYQIVYLSKNSKQYTKVIHRLVAQAFIPNPENKPQVNHIDGVKSHNNVNNLEWCTNGENQIHAYANGLNIRSELAGKPKKPVVQIDIGTNKIIKEFPSVSEAARQVGASEGNLAGCCRHDYGRKTVKGYKWEFKENYEGGEAL